MTAGIQDIQTSVAGDDAGAPPDTAAFVDLIPHAFARRHLLLLEADNRGPMMAVAAHTPALAIHNACVRLGQTLPTRIEDAETLATRIDRAYTKAAVPGGPAAGEEDAVELATAADPAFALRQAVEAAEQDLLHTGEKAPLVRLVDLLIFEALQRGASDIHVQPLAERVLVRYRLDGVLLTVRELPAGLAGALVSRIKVMARLDVAEQRAPQDGRASVRVGRGVEGRAGRRVDLRISTLPATYGERVVIRILDAARSAALLSFESLGMPPEVERPFQAQASRASGVVLVTGPTGSGKTTTLYTTLKWISERTSRGAVPQSAEHGAGGGVGRGSDCNIMTIEDPVEYDLSTGGLAVSQTQVNPRKNVTFATGLRHILRQDPDVIMVGEVRDEETARIAVQASLTGHLVLSTLHTNDAASAIARLLDLKVEPFLVSSSLSAVLAQRLVRRRHGACAGAGCDSCLGSGFQGRVGLFELLVMDESARELVHARAPASDLRQHAVRGGMTTLLEAGRRLAAAGETTIQEVARVVQGAGAEDEVLV